MERFLQGDIEPDFRNQPDVTSSSRTALIFGAIFVSAMLLSPVAHASDDPVENPYYVGVSGLVAFEKFDSNSDFTESPIAESSESFGVSAWAGKRISEHLALEGEFNWLDKFDVRIDRGHLGNPHADLDGWMLTANAKAVLPWGRIQPFAKLGGGVLHATIDTEDIENLSSDTTEDDFLVRLGGGLELYATSTVSLNMSAEYVLPVDALKKIPFLLINLGLQMRF